MKTIKTLDDVVEMVSSTDANLFVRYCAHPKKDIERGRSTDYATGRAHEGISTETLVDIRHGVWSRGDKFYIAMQISSYSFMRYQGLSGTKAYIFTGEYVGADSDNAYLISATAVVAALTESCVEEAIAYYQQNKTRR